MSKNLIIQDVAEVVITDLSTGKVMAQTHLQMSSIESTVNVEDLRAGIGNKRIYRIKSEKDLVISTRNAVFTEEALAMTQGVDIINNRQVEVTRAENSLCANSDGEFKIEADAVGDVVFVLNEDGEHEEVPVLDKVLDQADLEALFPVATGVGGDGIENIELYYKELVTGNSIEFDAEKFSKNVKLEMRTISYDLNTSEIYSDIYFIFPRASVSDDFSLSFEAGSVIAPEISFDILQPTCGSAMGEMINVPRVTTP